MCYINLEEKMLKKLTNILLTFAMFIIINVANANEFPDKTITIVCNWPAGGGEILFQD